jgi:Predicted membrane protein
MEPKNSLGMDAKTASWFSYILSVVSAIIVLVTVKDDKNVRTHAWQSLFLGGFFWILIIILNIISGIIWASVNPYTIFVATPGIVVLLGVISWLLSTAWLVLTILCILKATQGDIFKLPVIYDQAVKMN